MRTSVEEQTGALGGTGESVAVVDGNTAIAEAALRAGCRFFTGYPITPATEILEYMAQHMQQMGGVYVQAESEVAGIHMIYGAAAAGVRSMISSSSPGIVLMSEGFATLAAADLPCVIVNVCRGGPGNISGYSQGDYFFHTKGSGHGDFHSLVFSPSTVQEAVDLVYSAFDIAERYRTPVTILGDWMLSKTTEAVKYPPHVKDRTEKPPWALTGAKCRPPRRVLMSLWTEGLYDLELLERMTSDRYSRYDLAAQNEIRFEAVQVDDCDILIVSFGFVGRIAKTVVALARQEGYRVGLLRPISLYPFPHQAVKDAGARARKILVVEANTGQMIEDVKLAVCGETDVFFFGRLGGIAPSVEEIMGKIRQLSES
jgi:2-oxoglutarate ferredoxin oxidoreductase subunit alpha